MSTSVSFNGSSYSIPATSESNWGTTLSNYLIAIASGTLQRSGGVFTLTAEVDFGATYGAKLAYLKSQTANASTAGIIKLANTDAIGFRNAANSADLLLGVNASNQLTFAGNPIVSSTVLSSSKALASDSAGMIVASAVTATELGYVSGVTSAIQTQITANGSSISTHIADQAPHGATALNTASKIVARDGSGNFSAGTITANLTGNASGTASNITGIAAIANGGTGQSGKTAAFDALSPNTTKGDLTVRDSSNNVRVPVGSDGQVIVADSTQATGVKWSTLQAGSKNYLAYNSFENNATTGWSLFNTTLTSLIPTGSISAGASSLGTFAATATNPLAGTYSLSLGTASTVVAGQGVISSAITLDREDRGRVLGFEFNYEATTNPDNANWSGTSANSFQIYFHDGTSWKQPTGVYSMVQSRGVGKATGWVQFDSTVTAFQMAIVCINATTGTAFAMSLDDFKFGPATGATDATVVAATYIANSTSTISNGATATIVDFNSKQFDSASAVTTGPWRFTAPKSGYYRVSTKVTFGAAENWSNSAYERIYLYKNGAVVLCLDSLTNTAALTGVRLGSLKGSTVIFLSAGEYIDIRALHGETASRTVSNNGIESNETWISIERLTGSFGASEEARVVGARYYRSGSSQTIGLSGTTTPLNFNTKDYDTHSGVSVTTDGASTDWKYTAPVSGYYRFSLTAYMDAGCTAMQLNWRKNGGSYILFAGNSGTAIDTLCGTASTYLNAGDYLTFGLYYTSGTTRTFYNSAANQFAIERISGPNGAADAGQTVAARYTNAGNSGQSIPATGGYVMVDFGTGGKVEDNQSCYVAGAGYNAGTGAYTTTPGFRAPVAGLYQVSAQITFASNTTGNREMALYKNGSYYSDMAYWSSTSGTLSGSGSVLVRLNAGDVVSVAAYQASGGALALSAYSASSILTHANFVRVGN